jgi:hypothetical protein
MKPAAKFITNLILYDAAWTIAALAAARANLALGIGAMLAVAVVHVVLRVYAPREFPTLLLGVLLGSAADTLWLALGLFHLTSEPANLALSAAWFLSLWLGFSSVIAVSLRWMWPRPAIGFLFGALGGPLAYFIAAKIGAITFAEPMWPSLAAVSAQYAIIIPAWGFMLDRASRRSSSP